MSTTVSPNYFLLNHDVPGRSLLFVRGFFSTELPYANEVPDVFVASSSTFSSDTTIYEAYFPWFEPTFSVSYNGSEGSLYRVKTTLSPYYTTFYLSEGVVTPLYYFHGFLTASQLYSVCELAMVLPLPCTDSLLPDGSYVVDTVPLPDFSPCWTNPHFVPTPSE